MAKVATSFDCSRPRKEDRLMNKKNFRADISLNEVILSETPKREEEKGRESEMEGLAAKRENETKEIEAKKESK